MDCRQCQGMEREFSHKVAEGELKRYRKKGPGFLTRALIEALKAEGVEGMTLLDIGGGIGVIQHELLRAGASSATNVDASTAYLESARNEAERQGFADRVNYHYGDFVTLAPEIPSAGIVTLDCVICCYHDMPALVGLSAAHARKFYGLTYPRDTWWVKPLNLVANLYYRLRRCPYRAYLHPTKAMDAEVRAQGFRLLMLRRMYLWEVAVYGRESTDA